MATILDLIDHSQPAILYLAKPGKKPVCALNSVDYETVHVKINGINTCELSFDLYKNIRGTIGNGYDLIDEMMLIYCSGVWFKIVEPPETEFDGMNEIKRVTAESQEVELLQYDLFNFEINTGSAGSAEMIAKDNIHVNADGARLPKDNVKFCNREKEDLSLLHLVLKHANVPNWKVGYIDEEVLENDDPTEIKSEYLYNKVGKFSIDNKSVYSFLTQDVAQEFQCIFVFDTDTYTINAYAVEHLGKDTNIFLGYRNLSNTLTSTRESEIYTAFNVTGDEMSIYYANFGSSYINDISHYTQERYMDPELIEKYNAYISYRESKREEYIDLSIDYNTHLKITSELKDRVPIDDCNTYWDTFEDEDLTSVKEYYVTVINSIYRMYEYAKEGKDEDGNPTYTQDEDGFHILKDEYIGDDTKISEHSDILCNGNLKAQMIEDGCWYNFFQYRYNIYESILIEFENRQASSRDDQLDYIDAWETEWVLFGIDELKSKIKSYDDRIAVLQKNGYGDDYVEDSSVTGDYSATQHAEWVKLTGYRAEAQQALEERQAEYDAEKEKQDAIQEKRNDLVEDVDMENPQFNFNPDDIAIINSFYKYTDYQNENFFVSKYDTAEQEVQQHYDLYKDAVEALYAKAHPQYTYIDTIDNLYALPEFKYYQKQLNIFDFIYIEVSPDVFEKLRVVSISFNPCILENDMEIEFTSMVQYKTKRNDYAQLLDSQTKDAKNQIMGTLGSNRGLEYNVDSSVIKMILGSTAFGTVIKDATLGAVGDANSIINGQLTGDKLILKILQADQGIFNELSAKMITAEKIEAIVIESETIRSSIIESIEGRFQDIMTEFIDADYINARVVISDEALFNRLSVADLRAHLSSSEIITLISTETGEPTIAFKDSTQQFYDSEGNVRVQIGQDANGDFNFIVRGEDGVTAIYDENGITKDAIADGLIINNMIADETIDKGKLNFPIIEANEFGGISVKDIYDGTGELWGVKVETSLQETETKILGLDQKIEENIPFTLYLNTTNGNVLNRKVTESTIYVQLMKGIEEVTDTYEDSCFIWTRESSDSESDILWNEEHNIGSKSLRITRSDILYGATFTCSFIVDDAVVVATSF